MDSEIKTQAEAKSEAPSEAKSVGPYPITHDGDFGVFKGSDQAIRLDLACGNAKMPGFVGVDVAEDSQADLIVDLNTPRWQIEFSHKNNLEMLNTHSGRLFDASSGVLLPDSVYEIHCSHFVEHVKDLKAFMEECYRVLKNQSVLHIIAPYYTSIRASQDFTHVRGVSEATFLYFDQVWLKTQGLGHYGVKCNFKADNIRYYFDPEWLTRGDEARKWAAKHYWNVVLDIEFHLRVIKG